MTDQTSPNPYDAVLADLRAKRAEIDNAIEVLTRLRGGGAAHSGVETPAVAEPENHAGMFLGMSIVDAVLKLLTMRKRKMTNSEILKELTQGGMVLTSKEPINVVGSVLTRRFNEKGDIVRVDRGTWGLKSWYPGRNFYKAKSPEDALSTTDTADFGSEPTVKSPSDAGQEPGPTDVVP